MRVSRHDDTLNDAIAELDARLDAAGHGPDAVQLAWESLPPDELDWITKEIDHCATDRRYYLENYHVITDENGQLQTLYPFWDHQEIIYEVLEREWDSKGCVRLIILKPRQCGGTVWSAGIIFHRTIFLPQSFNMMMSNNVDNVAEIDRRMDTAFNFLPWWLRPEIMSRQQERHWVFQRSDERRRTVDPGLGSTLLISNAQKMAGVAIGKTIRSIHMSEVSRYENASVYTSDIKPSMNARDILAIMESTAFGRKGLFFNQWEAAEKGKSIWVPVFIPVYRVKKYFTPLLKGEKIILSPEERAIRIAVKEREGYTIPLGFFKWRQNDIQETVNSTGSEEDHFEAYPMTSGEAFISSGFCAFPKKFINEQERENVRDPILIGEIEYTGADLPPVLKVHPPDQKEIMEVPELYNRLWIWEEPDQNEAIEYYIGSDVASGDGSDFSHASVFKIGAYGEPDVYVASYHGLIDPTKYAKILAALGQYYHNAEIALEYAQSGITTGNELLHILDYPNIYRWSNEDKMTGNQTAYMHWMTTMKTRPWAIDTMSGALTERSVVLRDKFLIKEMRNFGRLDEGGKQAGIDGNDDMVMGTIISLAALRKKSRIYGEGPSSSSTANALIPKGGKIFGVYDQFMRQITQVPTKERAEHYMNQIKITYKTKFNQDIDPLKEGWSIREILAMQANTLYSPIHDKSGAEHELHYKHGVADRDILPDLVHSYRDLMTDRYYNGDGDEY